MKILITGATGLLGSNLAIRLKKGGHTVIGVGRNISKGKLLEDQGIQFIQCDISNKESVKSLPHEIDIIVHSAALSSPWGKRTDFKKINIDGTQHIVDLAKLINVIKLIHISSPSLYFKFKDELSIKENTDISPPHPSLYTESKYYAEQIVNEAVKKDSLYAVTLRPRGIFGPGDESILPRIVSLAKDKKLKQIGEGKNLVDITYVDNVSQAIELVINSDNDLRGEKFNITNGEPISQWDFINDLLGKLEISQVQRSIPHKIAHSFAWLLEILYTILPLNGEPRLTRYTVGLLCFNQTLDISKVRNMLGYSPEVSMEEGIKNVIKWWKENED